MTNYENLILSMLDEMDARLMEYLDGDTTGPSKHSIIDKYFKQIREDTKGECLSIFERYSPFEAAERIKKL